jgi:hypothetical protein
MKDSPTTIIYNFFKKYSEKEILIIEKELNEFGGKVVYKSIQTNSTFVVVQLDTIDLRINFENEFKLSALYRTTQEYLNEQKDEEIINAINLNFLKWEEKYLERIFIPKGSNSSLRKDESWNLLVILINEGLINVRVENYNHVPIPKETSVERHSFLQISKRLKDPFTSYLAWCGWTWLKEQDTESSIKFDTYATFFSPQLKTFLNLNHGSPFQLIYRMLGENSNRYVHIPNQLTNKLYIFEATELFHLWLDHARYGNYFDAPSKEQKVLAKYIHFLKGVEKTRNEFLALTSKRNEVHDKTTVQNNLLDEYEDDTLFVLEDAANIISQNKQTSSDLLEILINQGEIKAQRLRNDWVLSKKSILDYLEKSKSSEKKEILKTRNDEPIIKRTSEHSPDVARKQNTLKKHLMTLREVSDYMKNDKLDGSGIQPPLRLLKHLVRTGELKATRSNNSWLVDKKDLKDYLTKNINISSRNVRKGNYTVKKSNEISNYNGWTETKDRLLVNYVLECLKEGMSFDEIFSKDMKEIAMTASQCKNRWYSKWRNRYKDEIKKIMDDKSRQSPSNSQSKYEWNPENVKILIDEIIEGTRRGKTILNIIEKVSQNIGIPTTACQAYWSSKKIPRQYKEEYKKILRDQENWTDEELSILNYLITVQYAHLTPYDVLPFASDRLCKHINVVRKKFFELKKETKSTK